MRKLASIQKIKFIKPIPNADNIVCVGVLGWECVAKKDEFKENDLVVFFEIDSLLPVESRYEHLRKSCYRAESNRFRLKSVKLRGQISQGLVMPLSLFPELAGYKEGDDVTEKLNVEKYEVPVPAEISGSVKGGFNWPISKTDETRIQNDEEHGFLASLKKKPYYITLKLDGTSSTFLIHPQTEEYHVCGRNYSYQHKPDHSFWRISDKYKIEEGLRKLWDAGTKVALQGEVVGPGIQGNKLGLSEIDLYIFNVVDVTTNKKLRLDKALKITTQLGLKFAPIIETGDCFRYNRDELLEKAKGKYNEHFPSASHSQQREGIVIRSLNADISFKAINNEFLLKEDKEELPASIQNVKVTSDLNDPKSFEKVEQLKKDWKNLDQGPREIKVVPLTVGKSEVKPLTVDNSNVIPLTVEEPKPKTFWGNKEIKEDKKW